MENNSQYWIKKLGLVRHVEGGYYKQIFLLQRKNVKNMEIEI